MGRLGRRSFLGCAALCGLSGLPTEAAATGWRPPRTFEAGLPDLMRLALVPGVSAVILEKRRVVWTLATGLANVKTGQAISPDTLFEAASATKPIFAMAVARFAQSGALDLDRPLAAYFKPEYLPDHPRIREITARHVLSHASGLPNWGDDQRPETLVPRFAPGSAFSYSGEGYFWLQLVIEHVTSQSLDQFVRAQLFSPVSLPFSTMIGDAQAAKVAAFGHAHGRLAPSQGWRDVVGLVEPLAARWGKPVRDWRHEDWLRASAELAPGQPARRVRFANAAGSLLTTPAEYAALAQLLIDPQAAEAAGLDPRTVREIVRPQVQVRPPAPVWWGLGWLVEGDERARRISHQGNNDNRATAYAVVEPHSSRVLVLFANSGGGPAIYQRLVRAATGHDDLSFAADLEPEFGI